jgi:hypothetical protein
MMEEERLRIPVAQGLPWTTDEPEVSPFSDWVGKAIDTPRCLIKLDDQFHVLHG